MSVQVFICFFQRIFFGKKLFVKENYSEGKLIMYRNKDPIYIMEHFFLLPTMQSCPQLHSFIICERLLIIYNKSVNLNLITFKNIKT